MYKVMKFQLLLVSLTVLTFESCGPNAEEIAQQQKRRDDSIAAVSAAKVQHKNDLRNSLSNLRSEFDNLKAELVAANDKLNSLKEFHFLRTDEERADQLKKQSLYISKLEERKQDIELRITRVEQELASL